MATPRTGKPRGRPVGAKSKKSKVLGAAMTEAAERLSEAIPEAFQGDAHALLMSIYKDPAREWPLRVDAAKAAIRYEKPALSSVDSSGEAVKRAVVRLPHKAATSEEWQQLYAPTTTPQ